MGNNKMARMPLGEMLERVVNALEGLVITDEEGKYVFVSKRWTELTGLAIEDIRGIPTSKITPSSKAAKCLETRQPLYGEIIQVRSKDGGVVPMISYYTPLFEDDELIGCVTVNATQGVSGILDVSGRIDDMMTQLDYFKEELAKVQGARYSLDNIAGDSEIIRDMKKTIRRCARSASTVLIQGETGTGKELVAHSIHALSPRAAKPFVKINCAAIPEQLIESELFGYVGGAFTGANRAGKKGKFQMADGGTLFLDEINQLPLSLQPKLLRAIQEKEVEPVGAVKTDKVDVRIICASNQNLRKLVSDNLFREDLYYRLNVIPIRVPSLRERKEDIPAIAELTLRNLNEQLGMAVPGISEDAKLRLQGYDWPGNVRELRNVIERAMNDAWMEQLTWKHIRDYFESRPYQSPESINEKPMTISLREAKIEAEKRAIRAALDACGGNKHQAALTLGITRAMLYRKLEKYDFS